MQMYDFDQFKIGFFYSNPPPPKTITNVNGTISVNDAAVLRRKSTYVRFKSDDAPLRRLLPEETTTNCPDFPEKTVEILIGPFGGKSCDEYGVGRVIIVSDHYLVIQVGRR